MHDSNPFNFRKDTEQDLQEQILVERLNFANDICETLEMSAEDLIGLLSELVEAVEQLDELSPKTLGSYINKAHRSARKATDDINDAKTIGAVKKAHKVEYKRERGIRRATNNLVYAADKS